MGTNAGKYFLSGFLKSYTPAMQQQNALERSQRSINLRNQTKLEEQKLKSAEEQSDNSLIAKFLDKKTTEEERALIIPQIKNTSRINAISGLLNESTKIGSSSSDDGYIKELTSGKITEDRANEILPQLSDAGLTKYKKIKEVSQSPKVNYKTFGRNVYEVNEDGSVDTTKKPFYVIPKEKTIRYSGTGTRGNNSNTGNTKKDKMTDSSGNVKPLTTLGDLDKVSGYYGELFGAYDELSKGRNAIISKTLVTPNTPIKVYKDKDGNITGQVMPKDYYGEKLRLLRTKYGKSIWDNASEKLKDVYYDAMTSFNKISFNDSYNDNEIAQIENITKNLYKSGQLTAEDIKNVYHFKKLLKGK